MSANPAGCSFRERFVVSQEQQRLNARQLQQLDEQRRLSLVRKHSQTAERLNRIASVKTHFKRTRAKADIESAQLRAEISSGVHRSRPTEREIALEIAAQRMRAEIAEAEQLQEEEKRRLDMEIGVEEPDPPPYDADVEAEDAFGIAAMEADIEDEEEDGEEEEEEDGEEWGGSHGLGDAGRGNALLLNTLRQRAGGRSARRTGREASAAAAAAAQTRLVADAETGEILTLNTVVHDTEFMVPPPDPELGVDAITQSRRKLGDRVDWTTGFKKRVAAEMQESNHTVAALEARLEREKHTLTEAESNQMKAEILDKMKHQHHVQLAQMLEDEKQREMEREVNAVAEHDPIGSQRLLKHHEQERGQFKAQFLRVQEDCEMILVAKMAAFGFVR